MGLRSACALALISGWNIKARGREFHQKKREMDGAVLLL
jgi:hypothetical protein